MGFLYIFCSPIKAEAQTHVHTDACYTGEIHVCQGNEIDGGACYEPESYHVHKVDPSKYVGLNYEVNALYSEPYGCFQDRQFRYCTSMGCKYDSCDSPMYMKSASCASTDDYWYWSIYNVSCGYCKQKVPCYYWHMIKTCSNPKCGQEDEFVSNTLYCSQACCFNANKAINTDICDYYTKYCPGHVVYGISCGKTIKTVEKYVKSCPYEGKHMRKDRYGVEEPICDEIMTKIVPVEKEAVVMQHTYFNKQVQGYYLNGDYEPSVSVKSNLDESLTGVEQTVTLTATGEYMDADKTKHPTTTMKVTVVSTSELGFSLEPVNPNQTLIQNSTDTPDVKAYLVYYDGTKKVVTCEATKCDTTIAGSQVISLSYTGEDYIYDKQYREIRKGTLLATVRVNVISKEEKEKEELKKEEEKKKAEQEKKLQTMKENTPAINLVSSSNCIVLNWAKRNNIKSYEIYRSVNSNGGFQKVATVTSPGYTDSKITSNVLYYYKVKSVNQENLVSNDSNIVKALLPQKSKLSKKKITKSSIQLKWKQNKLATGYQIYRSTKKNGGYKCIKTIEKNTITSYTDKKKKSNTYYYYKIKTFYNNQKIKIESLDSAILKCKTKK